MTDKAINRLNILLLVLVFALLQACLLDAECAIAANGRTSITIKTKAPLLVHRLFTQSDATFRHSLNRTVLEQRAGQFQGTVLTYTSSETGDTGVLETSMQFGNPEDAGKFAELFGVGLLYTSAGRTFTCSFKDTGNVFSAELANYADIVLRNIDLTLRCTVPQTIIRAPNGVISGNKAVFTKTFTKLADFFQSAVYTVQW